MAATADDLLDFYGANLGPSVSVPLTVASAVSERLKPGRYLVQAIGLGANLAWVRVGGFSGVSPPVAALASPSTPMQAGGMVMFYLNVRPNHNDQIAGIMSAGTATLVLTPISRVPAR